MSPTTGRMRCANPRSATVRVSFSIHGAWLSRAAIVPPVRSASWSVWPPTPQPRSKTAGAPGRSAAEGESPGGALSVAGTLTRQHLVNLEEDFPEAWRRLGHVTLAAAGWADPHARLGNWLRR